MISHPSVRTLWNSTPRPLEPQVKSWPLEEGRVRESSRETAHLHLGAELTSRGPCGPGQSWESVSQNLPRRSDAQIELLLFSPRTPASTPGDFLKHSNSHSHHHYFISKIADETGCQLLCRPADLGPDPGRGQGVEAVAWGGGQGSAPNCKAAPWQEGFSALGQD